MPKAYPPEFRRCALDLVQAGRSVVQVAADLGISQGCLYAWRKQELIDRGQSPGLSTVQAAESATARRRIRNWRRRTGSGGGRRWRSRTWFSDGETVSVWCTDTGQE